MTFDNEQQRKLILDLINAATFLGKDVDVLYGLKQQVLAGKIPPPKLPKDN